MEAPQGRPRRRVGLPVTAPSAVPAGETFRVPPPAQSIPGVQGTLPLPVGRPVRVTRPLPEEAAILTQLGWKPGDAIPVDMAKHIAAASKDAQAEVSDPARIPLPVPPDTPPVTMPPPIDLGALPPASREALRAVVADANVPGPAATMQMGQGVAEAMQAAAHPTLDVVDDRKPPLAADTPAADTAGGTTETTECPHCGWDLHMADAFPITETDKRNFLQAMLGGVPFQKLYDLLGGQLQITFRTLRPAEVDLVYKQVYVDRQRGEILFDRDFYEKMARYRMATQLVDFRTPEMIHDFPPTLTEEDWGKMPEGEDTIVKYAYDEALKTVLKTESILRLVAATEANFNRLVAKLEAHADDPSFWEATRPGT